MLESGVQSGRWKWRPGQAPSVSRGDNGEQTHNQEGRPPRRAGDRAGSADNAHFIQCFSRPLSVKVRCFGILH